MSDTAPPVCVHCRKQCASRFEIKRFDTGGADRGTVICCSIAHLIAWAYEYGTLQGMQLAFGVKNSVASLLASLRGLK